MIQRRAGVGSYPAAGRSGHFDWGRVSSLRLVANARLRPFADLAPPSNPAHPTTASGSNKAGLESRFGERIEPPIAQLWNAGGHVQQLRCIAGIDTELSIVAMVFSRVPLLEQEKLIWIGIVP